MPGYLLTLTYDGTDFGGWQTQPGTRTVQGVLEARLAELFEPGVRAVAAGRTDAGVHAIAMPASFNAAKERDPETVVRALNAGLPEDVRVRRCRTVPESFSARYDAVSRVYEYRLRSAPATEPLTRRYEWTVPGRLDWDAVGRAMAALPGDHDFTSFRAAGCNARSPRKTMIDTRITNQGAGRYSLRFEAVGFVRGMIRSLVGTLVEIGRGDRPETDMAKLLASPDRAAAGRTAPPQGLFFVCARYPEMDGCEFDSRSF